MGDPRHPRRGQHLHPPRCVCDVCPSFGTVRWRLRFDLPTIAVNPRVLRSETFGHANDPEPSRAGAAEG